jgi:cobalt/nickel transport system permease protein
MGVLLLIAACTLAERPESLVAAVFGTWLLAAASGLDLRRFFLALSLVPLFTLALAVPACLNVVTGGPAVLVLLRYPAGSLGPWRWPENLAVTAPGLYVAVRFVLRSTACVSLAALLTASTSPPELLRGLRGLGVPSPFVMAAGMMARYLALLLRGAEEIHMAKLSRSIGGVDVARAQAWAAASLGETFRRSRALAEEVTHAMISRGYSGEAKSLTEPRLRVRDGLFLGACAAAAALLCWKG